LLASKLSLLLLASSLAACETTAELIPPENLYPTALTTCVKEPTITERTDKTKPRSEREKADYVKGLRGAYLDCSDTVSGWADRRARYVKQYEQQTFGYFGGLWRAVTGKTGTE